MSISPIKKKERTLKGRVVMFLITKSVFSKKFSFNSAVFFFRNGAFCLLLILLVFRMTGFLFKLVELEGPCFEFRFRA